MTFRTHVGTMTLAVLAVLAACNGGTAENVGPTLAPAPGGACATEGEQTGYSNGTLRCERDGDQLVWRSIRIDDGPGATVHLGPPGVECGSTSNPTNPLARPTDNANVRASLDAFPLECMKTAECAPKGDQAEYQWYRTDYNLAIDPRNPARLLVGVERLGLFESLDRGDTWRPASEDGIVHALSDTDGTVCWTQVTDITFDPAVPGRIYLHHGGGGTIAAGIWQARGAGLYRSDDDGRTWQLMTTPDINAYVAGFTIDPTSSDTLYVGTSSSPQTSVDAAPVAYVTDGLLYRSDDAGRTWRELPTGWGARTGGSFVWVDPSDPAIVLLGVYQYSDAESDGAPTGTGLGPGWYRSTDGGRSWAPHGTGDGAVAPVTYNVAISPDGTTILSPSDDYLWVSPDGGATWTGITPPRWVPTIDPHGDGRRVYAILSAEWAGTALDQFTVSTDGGVTWKVLGELPPEMRMNEFNEPPLNRRAMPSNIVVDPIDPDVVYATGAGGTIARSTDGGSTWVLLTTWETFPASTVEFR